MQANSATLEGLFVVQPWTIVGSNGIATGDHRTRIMPTNPNILEEKNSAVWEDVIHTLDITTCAYMIRENHH